MICPDCKGQGYVLAAFSHGYLSYCERCGGRVEPSHKTIPGALPDHKSIVDPLSPYEMGVAAQYLRAIDNPFPVLSDEYLAWEKGRDGLPERPSYDYW